MVLNAGVTTALSVEGCYRPMFGGVSLIDVLRALEACSCRAGLVASLQLQPRFGLMDSLYSASLRSEPTTPIKAAKSQPMQSEAVVEPCSSTAHFPPQVSLQRCIPTITTCLAGNLAIKPSAGKQVHTADEQEPPYHMHAARCTGPDNRLQH